MEKVPGVLSAEFHTLFFPRLLWERLRPRQAEPHSRFLGPQMELTLLAVGCLTLFVVFSPIAVEKGGLFWVLTGIGGFGLLGLAVMSVWRQVGIPVAYEEFRFEYWVLCLLAGVTGGVAEGLYLAGAFWGGVSGGVTGLVAGHLVGIMAGLWVQKLGWIRGFLDLCAYGGIIGLAVVDVVLLIGR